MDEQQNYGIAGQDDQLTHQCGYSLPFFTRNALLAPGVVRVFELVGQELGAEFGDEKISPESRICHTR